MSEKNSFPKRLSFKLRKKMYLNAKPRNSFGIKQMTEILGLPFDEDSISKVVYELIHSRFYIPSPDIIFEFKFEMPYEPEELNDDQEACRTCDEVVDLKDWPTDKDFFCKHCGHLIGGPYSG